MKEINIKPIDVEIYQEGICFLCQQKCHPKGYLHRSCAIAYSEHKAKTILDLQKQKEIKQDKYVNKVLNK